MAVAKFAKFLAENGSLREIVIGHPNPNRKDRIVRYAWAGASPFHVALSLRRDSYLCHSAAAFVLGLSDIAPRRIYVNVEQSPKPMAKGALTQRGIDLAFQRPQRQSSQIYQFEDQAIVLLNGKHSNGFETGEVEYLDGIVRSTRLERTLVDLTVRPAYGGGVSQVLEAFRRAKDRASTMKILAVLDRLDYVYPYHQALGFYMERAGFKEEQHGKLKKLGLNFDFYLAHDMRELEHDSTWRVYYPKGF